MLLKTIANHMLSLAVAGLLVAAICSSGNDAAYGVNDASSETAGGVTDNVAGDVDKTKSPVGAKADAKVDAGVGPKPDTKTKPKTDAKPESNSDPKPALKPGLKPGNKETVSGSVTHTFLATGAQTYIVEYDDPNGSSGRDIELALGDVLFSNFEQDSYRNWVAIGKAFGSAPMPLSRLSDDPITVGADGAGLVDSRNVRNLESGVAVEQGDAFKGVMISKTFVLKHRYIRLLVGGTVDKKRTCIQLVVEGKVVKSLTGRGTGEMRVEHVNVTDYEGKTAYLKIVDQHDRGYVRIDHIVLSNTIRDQKRRIGGGKVVWRYNKSVRDGWILPDGHVLLALKGTTEASPKVLEIGRDFREYFKWESEQEEISSVQRLSNGNTLVAEVGKEPRLLEINSEGEVVVTVPLKAQTRNLSLQLGSARKLENGNYLVAEMFDKMVREYDKKGEVVWQAELEHWPYSAVRLDSGNTLVSCSSGGVVLELDKEGKTVWSVSGSDLPGVTLHDAAGIQRLENGNTIICDQDAGRKRGPKIIEVTPDKRIVWTYRDTSRIGINSVHVTHSNGKRLGQALR